MSSVRETAAPLAYSFRVRHLVFGCAIVASLLLAVSLSPPQHAPRPATAIESGIVILAISYGFFRIVGRKNLDSPLIGGYIGTAVGTTVFMILEMCLYSAAGPESLMDWIVLLGLMPLSAFTLSFAAIVPAYVLGWLRKRHDVWSGVVCGGAVGLIFGFDKFLPASIRFSALILITSYAGWGAAMQPVQAVVRKRFLPRGKLESMPTSPKDDDRFHQLRATAFVLIALGMMALALLRRDASVLSIFESTIAVTAIAASAAVMFAAVYVPIHGSALLGAWLAIVLGGGLLAIANVAGDATSFEEPLTHDFFIGLVGVLKTALWSPLGLAAAWLLSLVRKRHDFLSGIVCGAITGAALTGDVDPRNPTLLINTALLAACGGWGAAAQRARFLAHGRRTTLPEDIDDVACQTVAKHPKPPEEPLPRGRFRIRKVLEMPVKMRRWWPY